MFRNFVLIRYLINLAVLGNQNRLVAFLNARFRAACMVCAGHFGGALLLGATGVGYVPSPFASHGSHGKSHQSRDTQHEFSHFLPPWAIVMPVRADYNLPQIARASRRCKIRPPSVRLW